MKRYVLNLDYFNKNNIFIKKFFRYMKNKKMFNNNYITLDRYIECIPKETTYIDSIYYNFDIPNLLIPTDVDFHEYTITHKEFILIHLEELMEYVKKTFNLENDILYNITITNIKTKLNNDSYKSIKDLIIEEITYLIKHNKKYYQTYDYIIQEALNDTKKQYELIMEYNYI